MKTLLFVPVSGEQPAAQSLAGHFPGAVSLNLADLLSNPAAALYGDNLDALAEALLLKIDERAGSAPVLLLNGLSHDPAAPYGWELNRLVQQWLQADVVLVADRSSAGQLQHGAHYFQTQTQASAINAAWAKDYLAAPAKPNHSGAYFRFNLVKKAIAAQKTIVLPEGDEPRTVQAANSCAQRRLAKCVLLAPEASVRAVAAQQGIELHPDLVILDPSASREKYVARLVELRKAKGLTEEQAREMLADNVVLGTMMLEAGEVDGLVSGAVHTTANTIRPPLQIIKMAPGAATVSSVFFMCLPDQVLVYGDCAVVPNPTAAELASIASQSHDSAKAFGLEPRVALLSYSTGNSGSGPDVDLVKEATRLVREARPDILVDGPLQYDAASVASVGRQKAPESPVAGRANVFIFPDLSAGNIAYKAVQRTAGAIAVGPVLQGMRKPVNDLSRGALVEDIVYTIAITAVQAV